MQKKSFSFGVYLVGAILGVAFLLTSQANAGGSHFTRTVSELQAKNATVINFENSTIDPITGFWDNYGFKITSDKGKAIYVTDYNRGGKTSSGQYSISNDATWPNTSANDPLKITFKNGVNAVGFYLGNGYVYGEQVNVQIKFYDQNGNLMGEDQIGREKGMDLNGGYIKNEVTSFFGFETLNPFYSVTIDYGNSLLSEEIDDLMFVPVTNNVRTCSDTDGNNKYTKGYNVIYNADGSAYLKTNDSCRDSSTVYEYTCSGSTWNMTYETCGAGYTCSDGACISSVITNPAPKVVGFVAYDQTRGAQLTENVNTYKKLGYFYKPQIVSVPITLNSFNYTLKISQPSGNFTYGFIWSNKGENEQLDYNEANVISIVKSVNFVSSYMSSFNVTDYYRGKYVMLYAFARNNDGRSEVPNMPVEVDDVVPIYLKFEKAVQPNIQCTETDGGLNYNTRGTTTGNNEGDNVWDAYGDSCGTSVGDQSKYSGDYIAEKHCSGTADKPYVHTQWYKCPNGCENGACKAARVITGQCTETDNGNDIYNKGTTNYYGTTYEDACESFTNGVSVQESQYLREYACEGFVKTTYCKSGCSNGACVQLNNNDVVYWVGVNDPTGTKSVPIDGYVNMYTVVVNANKNGYDVVNSETKFAIKIVGAKFIIKPGQMVFFEGFKTKAAAQKGIELKRVNKTVNAPDKNFSREDGRLCQTNFFDTDHILKNSFDGHEQCSINMGVPYLDDQIPSDSNTTPTTPAGCYYVSYNGFLGKVSDNPNIWYIDNSTKHLFTSSVIYKTWFKDYYGVRTMNTNQMNGYVLGENVCTNPDQTTVTPPAVTCKDYDSSPIGGGNETTPDVFVRSFATGIYLGSDPNISQIYGSGVDPFVPRRINTSYSFYYDHCATETQLNEAFCDDNGKMGSIGIQCKYGCKEGSCVKPPLSATMVCGNKNGGDEEIYLCKSNIYTHEDTDVQFKVLSFSKYTSLVRVTNADKKSLVLRPNVTKTVIASFDEEVKVKVNITYLGYTTSNKQNYAKFKIETFDLSE